VTKLVLASASASRFRLLTDAGIAAERDPADIDEAVVKTECRQHGQSAVVCARRLAEAKARIVAPRHAGALVLGADQMLECEGRWYDKPVDLADARAQLQALSGHRHTLVTAAVVVRDHELLWHAVETSTITMRALSESFLDHYLAAFGDPVLKTVGGYELEGLGAQLMDKAEGDYFAILGLPLLGLLRFLRETGVLMP
jgi:septum formation protein